VRVEKRIRYYTPNGEYFTDEQDAYLYLAWCKLLDGRRVKGDVWDYNVRILQKRLARYLQWLDSKRY
jgi:hypothetical protein